MHIAPGSQADWQSPSSVVQYWFAPHCSLERHFTVIATELFDPADPAVPLRELDDDEVMHALLVQAMPPPVQVHMLQPSGDGKLSPTR